MRRPFIGQIIIAGFLLGSNAAAAETATSWLTGMLDSMAFNNYAGTFVYLQEDRMDVIKIETGVSTAGRTQTLAVLNGPERKIALKNGVLSWFHRNYWQKVGAPENVSVKPSQLFYVWQERLSRYYKMELADESRIAGRLCQRIHIRPADRLRYGYELCIDNANKVLLESKLLDRHGNVLEHMMFTSLDFGIEPVASAIDGLPASEVISKRAALDIPILQRMPAGFKLMSREMKQMEGAPAAVEHWRISDGLANISVYVEPAKPDASGLAGGSNVGALSVYGMMNNGYQVTIIGDVPTLTLQAIADALGS